MNICRVARINPVRPPAARFFGGGWVPPMCFRTVVGLMIQNHSEPWIALPRMEACVG
jgi:hypothetical protein